jgi:hypothetical protein
MAASQRRIRGSRCQFSPQGLRLCNRHAAGKTPADVGSRSAADQLTPGQQRDRGAVARAPVTRVADRDHRARRRGHKCRVVQCCSAVVAGRADDRYLGRAGHHSLGHSKTPARGARVPGGDGEQRTQGPASRCAVPGGAGQGRVAEQRASDRERAGGAGPVGGLGRPVNQPLPVVRGVVEAAVAPAEPVQRGLQKPPGQADPAALPGDAGQGQEALGNAGVVLKHPGARAGDR